MCAGPMLADALVTVNASLLSEITDMTPEQIQMNGVVTLAKLQGQLKHERALIDLSIVQPDLYGAPPEETYPDPSEDLPQDEVAPDETSPRRILAEFNELLFTPEPPKAKRKYVRKKKRKKNQ